MDPNSDVGVSTCLDAHEVYSKADSPPRLMSNLETRYVKLTVS